MNRSLIWAAAAIASVALPGCVNRDAQAQAKQTEKIVTDPVRSVTTTRPETATLFDELEITGDLVTSEDVQIGPKIGGRIVSMMVRDGDSVSAGQVLASIDASTLRIQLQQAIAQLTSARAQLEQARTNAAVGPTRSLAGVRAAEAQVRSARAQLDKALKGARDEERVQVDWQVKNAKSNLDTTEREVERVRKLVDEGAVEKKRLDQAQNALIAAQSAYNAALQSQLILTNGVRPEDIASARESVRQAEEQLRSAKATQNLDALLGQQVAAARAAVDGAKAQVDLIRQSLSDTEVRAPFSGRVGGRPTEIGTVVGAGTPIVRLVGGAGTYFEGQVPETSITRLSVGRAVKIEAESAPGRTFAGTIAAISPAGSSVGRLFSVRVSVTDGLDALKPGMFARGKVTLNTVEGAMVVPANAVLSGPGKRYVVVMEGENARHVTVSTGLSRGDRIQVSGLSSDAKVIVQGQEGLIDGAKVREGGN